MQNTKSKYKKLKKIVTCGILAIVIAFILYDVIATFILNHKYNSVVSYDPERRRTCEINGDEYIIAGKCSVINWDIGVAVQIYNVYYDEENPNVSIILEIKENKIGSREYKIGFDDDGKGKWGGYVYIDEKCNPISRYNEGIDEKSVEIMRNLKVDVKRVIELANLKWDLGMTYNEPQ